MKRNSNTKHPLFKLYFGMIERCTKPYNQAYQNYGGRGIKVCERWMNDFQAFVEDVGERPSPKHCLDRIDNDGDYEPGNVRWATYTENIRNSKRIVLNPAKVKIIKQMLWDGYTPAQISELAGCGRTTIYQIKNNETWSDVHLS